ncbi:hypothetical protein GMRT_12754 [Giardia muris]|uniref:JAB1/MPN/MOV34 metalloenzyme domain-containing protein n=1 Tax=Giardia muris TaxID=5742 RepID=A0A4Z1SS50_GIAMU|nr:hypothetical protein GMRT_12754 [Giardia muris]|eukprot:TNJ28590.1 hypothetical protein GMRT_12754 [Giardia muris]
MLSVDLDVVLRLVDVSVGALPDVAHGIVLGTVGDEGMVCTEFVTGRSASELSHLRASLRAISGGTDVIAFFTSTTEALPLRDEAFQSACATQLANLTFVGRPCILTLDPRYLEFGQVRLCAYECEPGATLKPTEIEVSINESIAPRAVLETLMAKTPKLTALKPIPSIDTLKYLQTYYTELKGRTPEKVPFIEKELGYLLSLEAELRRELLGSKE